MISEKQFNMVSQFSHFGWGLAVVLTGNLFHKALPVGGLWLLYAAIKEFFYDERYETPEVRGSSLEDFVFQAMGAGVALVLIAVA